MPIGLTARGDLVFPMQCRELIERERGPIPEEKQQISEPRSQQVPSAKTAPAEKVTPVAVAPAEKVTPVAVAPVAVTSAEKDAAAAPGQAQERARKRLARAERRKQQGPATAAASDPQTTGSTTQATGSSLRWFSTTR